MHPHTERGSHPHHPSRSADVRTGFAPGRELRRGDFPAAPAGGPRRRHRMDPAEHGHGPHRHRGGGRGRVARGDVRAAVLLLLSEEPMHGYQLMQTIGDRSGGRWTPSPGAIYPTLNQLEDEGLVSVTADAGRKLATLTETGRAHVEAQRASWPDPFGAGSAAPGGNLRGLLEELHVATRQVARTGTDAQRTAAAEILSSARRSLYLLLADGPSAATNEPTPEADSV